MALTDSTPVLIEFGAKIDKLVEATEQVRDRLEGLSNSAHSLGASFNRLGELITAAFSIDRIAAFIERMAILGERTESTAAVLGISASSVGTLSGLAKVGGTSIDALSLSLGRMSLNVQRSVRDGFDPAAQGLKVLGLRASDLIGLSADKYLDKMREAVSQFNPSLNLTNAIMAISGRNVAQMIPLLQLSSESYQKLKAQIAAAQDELHKFIPGMADTHTKLALLDIGVQSLGARIFTALKPAIDGIIGSFQDFVANVKEMTKAGNALSGTFDFFVLVVRLSASAIAALTSGVLALGVAIEGVFKLATGDIYGFEEAARTTASSLETIGADLKKRLETIWSSPVPVTIHATGRDAGALNAGARQAIEAQRARYQAEIVLLQENLAQRKLLYDLDATLWKTTDDRKFALTMEATQREFAEEQDKLRKIRDLWPAHSKEWESEQLKMTQAVAKFGTEMVRLNAESLKSTAAKFSEVFDQIQTSFNSSLRGLLAGTTTWAQAFKTVLGDLVIYFIQAVEKMVFKWIAGQLAELAATQAAEGAKTAAAIAGETARTGATEVGALARIGTVITETFAEIGAKLAAAFAGLVAAFSFLGPFAVPAALGVIGGAGALAYGMIKGFEVGTDFVPYTGLAVVHKGEKIIPASENAAPYSGNGGAARGGGSVVIHALDGASVMRVFKTHADMINRVLGDRRAVSPGSA